MLDAVYCMASLDAPSSSVESMYVVGLRGKRVRLDQVITPSATPDCARRSTTAAAPDGRTGGFRRCGQKQGRRVRQSLACSCIVIHCVTPGSMRRRGRMRRGCPGVGEKKRRRREERGRQGSEGEGGGH